MNTQLKTDKLSIIFSLACVVHCLFMPSFLILGSGFLAISLDSELIHKILLIMVAPISIYALISGYKNHKIFSYLYIGASGLLFLTVAAILGEGTLGEFYVKGLTLLGSSIVAYAHFKNYQTCRALDCSCHE